MLKHDEDLPHFDDPGGAEIIADHDRTTDLPFRGQRWRRGVGFVVARVVLAALGLPILIAGVWFPVGPFKVASILLGGASIAIAVLGFDRYRGFKVGVAGVLFIFDVALLSLIVCLFLAAHAVLSRFEPVP